MRFVAVVVVVAAFTITAAASVASSRLRHASSVRASTAGAKPQAPYASTLPSVPQPKPPHGRHALVHQPGVSANRRDTSTPLSDRFNAAVMAPLIRTALTVSRRYIHHRLLKHESTALGRLPEILDTVLVRINAQPWFGSADASTVQRYIAQPIQDNLAAVHATLREDLVKFVDWVNDVAEARVMVACQAAVEAYFAVGETGARERSMQSYDALKPYLADPSEAAAATYGTHVVTRNDLVHGGSELPILRELNAQLRHLHAYIMRAASLAIDDVFRSVIIPTAHAFVQQYLAAFVIAWWLPSFNTGLLRATVAYTVSWGYTLLRSTIEALAREMRAITKREMGQVMQNEIWQVMFGLRKPIPYQPHDEEHGSPTWQAANVPAVVAPARRGEPWLAYGQRLAQ